MRESDVEQAFDRGRGSGRRLPRCFSVPCLASGKIAQTAEDAQATENFEVVSLFSDR